MSAGKILFVEDELSKNVANLLRLFEQHLSPDEKKSLKDIENDASGFGATNEEIKAVFNDNPFIDVEYSFSRALKAVVESHDDYDLFIVDRNLSSADTDLNEIQAINKDFSESMHKQYSEREGDYLLLLLATNGINCSDSFYFMTAYGAGEALRNEDTIASLIALERFRQDNFLEKGRKDDFIRLRNKIVNDLALVKFRDVFAVFEDGLLDNDSRKKMVDAIKNMDTLQYNNIDKNALNVRQILESIYDALAKRTGLIPPTICKYGELKTLQHEDGKLKIRGIIKHLRENQELSGIQLAAVDFIYSMASEIIHDGSKIALASKYSNHTLVHGLCDSILWFKEKMKEQGCK